MVSIMGERSILSGTRIFGIWKYRKNVCGDRYKTASDRAAWIPN